MRRYRKRSRSVVEAREAHPHRRDERDSTSGWRRMGQGYGAYLVRWCWWSRSGPRQPGLEGMKISSEGRTASKRDISPSYALRGVGTVLVSVFVSAACPIAWPTGSAHRHGECADKWHTPRRLDNRVFRCCSLAVGFGSRVIVGGLMEFRADRRSEVKFPSGLKSSLKSSPVIGTMYITRVESLCGGWNHRRTAEGTRDRCIAPNNVLFCTSNSSERSVVRESRKKIDLTHFS